MVKGSGNDAVRNGEVMSFYDDGEGEGKQDGEPTTSLRSARWTSRVGWRGRRVGKGAAIVRVPFGWGSVDAIAVCW